MRVYVRAQLIGVDCERRWFPLQRFVPVRSDQAAQTRPGLQIVGVQYVEAIGQIGRLLLRANDIGGIARGAVRCNSD